MTLAQLRYVARTYLLPGSKIGVLASNALTSPGPSRLGADAAGRSTG